ncbi:MAG: Uma2 family endonuclease [Geitlerinemataceae cyanobacterium]
MTDYAQLVRTECPNRSKPDVAVVRGVRSNYATRHPGGAHILLAIEMSKTTLSSDLTLKRGLHTSAGIPEHWGVDLQHRRVEVFRESNGKPYRNQ